MLNVDTMLSVLVCIRFYLYLCGGLLVLPDFVVQGFAEANMSFTSLEGLATFIRVPSANRLTFLAPVPALTTGGAVSFPNSFNGGLRPPGCVLGLTDSSALVVRLILFVTN